MPSLIFSYWTTTLDSLASALSSCNMSHVRIDGSLSLDQRRKVIEKFQSEPGLRIMLLTFGSGSVGSVSCSESNSTRRFTLTMHHRRLNLTAATHVHLMEPQWNPMVEAQAAARVDRLDQDKNVVILRYIVKDSIEEVFRNPPVYNIFVL